MSNELFITYDDIKLPSETIKKIIGDHRFATIYYKKDTFFDRFKNEVENDAFKLEQFDHIQPLIKLLEKSSSYKKFIHWFSYSVIIDNKALKLFIEKLDYLNEDIVLNNQSILGFAFKDKESYLNFLKNYLDSKETHTSFTEYSMDFALDISTFKNFQKYITDTFSTRFFNSISYTDYTVTKTSENTEKIKKEYLLYDFLGEDTKQWFIKPFNYSEKNNTSSYTMERLYITDIALQWVHHAIGIESFEELLNKAFYFISSRKKKDVDKQDFLHESDKLYVDKLKQRLCELKESQAFLAIEAYIKNGTEYHSIDEIFDEYFDCYHRLIKKKKSNFYLAVGHGDLCFSNMLYDESTSVLKLIDPMGALKEDDAFVVPTYDLAKLAHSICGNYDFINSNIYDIDMDKDLNFKLRLNFDNTEYKTLFQKHLEQNGFDYHEIRLYESSLFLSMLPLHLDRPRNVFAFILNAIDILKEIKNA